jgi:hypothetical protein
MNDKATSSISWFKTPAMSSTNRCTIGCGNRN